MLRPHLLITILVFAALGALIAHYAAKNHWSWSSPSATASSDSNSGTGVGTGSGTGTTTTTNSTHATDAKPNNGRRADNDSYGEEADDNNNSSASSGDGDERNVPGQFDYYSLTLSWSPTYCADQGQDDDTQCNRRDGRRYSFVLHGLWPQYERGWPSNCPLSRQPFVPQPIIDSMMDIMPSRRLVIHEYRTHGTCSGLDPARYFSTAHRIFDGIQIPQRFRNPMEPQFISPADIRSAFLRANPRFDANMIAVVCGGRRLKEVRLCLSRDGQPRACGANENQQKLCSTDQVFVPPARSTVSDTAPQRAPASDANWSNGSPSDNSASTNRNGSGPYAAPQIAPGDSLPGPKMDSNR